MNERFHNALKGVPQKVPPIWFMRQAGRYHRHYQALRKQHGFMELCKNADLAAEVARGPVADFDFDVSIMFSDLLFPLEAFGMGLRYDPAPQLDWHLNEKNLHQLRPFKDAIVHLEFQREVLRATRRVLPAGKSLIGFVGGPWTLFTYAAEGEHKGNLIPAKTHLPLFHAFCERLMPLLEVNIQLQLDGGAEVVMLFDTAAGELSPAIFKSDLQPYLFTLAKKFPGRLGYYSKSTTQAHVTELRREKHFTGLGFDHRFDIATELKATDHGFVQGNFDQALLFCAPDEFKERLDQYLKPLLSLAPEERRFWVAGLGHGVLPQTPEANVREFVRYVREEFARC